MRNESGLYSLNNEDILMSAILHEDYWSIVCADSLNNKDISMRAVSLLLNIPVCANSLNNKDISMSATYVICEYSMC